MTIGKRERRLVANNRSRLCGHCSRGPSGVEDQSKARTRSPISPPPISNEKFSACFIINLFSTTRNIFPRVDQRALEKSAQVKRCLCMHPSDVRPLRFSRDSREKQKS